MSDFAYASPAAIASEMLSLLLPPERLTVDQWAVRKRWLNNAGGGHVGLFPLEKTPYLREPMRCLTTLDHLTVALVGPGQVAKTVVAENWLGWSIDVDPGGMLWYMQTDDAVEAYVKDRINPFVDDHPFLKAKQGRRPVDDSLHFKRFNGMKVEFLSATMKALINKSAPRIVADEIDAWEFLGDVKTLLDIRRQTFGRQSKLLAISHPDRARGSDPGKDWLSGIMSIYGDSDRRNWFWPCPVCGGYSSPGPNSGRVMSLDYPTDPDIPLEAVARAARLICPCNGCVIADHEREAMNLAAMTAPHGGWIGAGQEISEGGQVSGALAPNDTAGFWIVGAMSPFVIGGIGGLARARVKADRDREVSGEDDSLREVIVKQWGFCFDPPRAVGSVSAQELVERTDPALKLQLVPEGVRFYVVSVDCQIAHFEILKRGFGIDGESWILDARKIPADPAKSAEDWDQLLEDAMTPLELADGSLRIMAPRAFGFDSHGQPGVTQQAYQAWTRWRRLGKPRLYGHIGGRDAWSIIPLRGASGINAPRLQITYPDTSRQSNRKAARGAVPVGTFNPNLFKNDLAGQLRQGEAGPWYVHFPAALKSRGDVHHWFEQLCAEHQLANGRWGKISPTARNEALDLMVMSHVVAHLHGLARIDWAKPPAWADAWEINPQVMGSVTVLDPNAVPKSAARALADRLA